MYADDIRTDETRTFFLSKRRFHELQFLFLCVSNLDVNDLTRHNLTALRNFNYKVLCICAWLIFFNNDACIVPTRIVMRGKHSLVFIHAGIKSLDCTALCLPV